MLLKLVDGGIIDIETDSEYNSGCETCDYGSSYINYISIKLTKNKVKVTTTKEYDHLLSDGYVMELILPNVELIKEMTEAEFVEWVKEKAKSLLPVDSIICSSIEFVVEGENEQSLRWGEDY